MKLVKQKIQQIPVLNLMVEQKIVKIQNLYFGKLTGQTNNARGAQH
jgi:hypothetical protein